MEDKRPQVTADGKCANCGSDSLTLAIDQTIYTPYRMYDGTWMDGGESVEAMDNDDPQGNVRFFCADCGTYHQVPEELV